MDQRRRQWLPLDSSFMFGRLATRLRDEFGPVGPLVWIGFITACKRSPIQGRITYGSDIEAWTLMGFPRPVDNFDLDAFWTRLAQLKKARRTTRGALTESICTVWEAWNNPTRTPPKPQVRGTNYKQITEKYKPITTPDSDSEKESDKTAGADPKQAVDKATEEVQFRIDRGDSIRHPEALIARISECYRGECTDCKSPLHGEGALWWHHARRLDEGLEAKVAVAKRRGNGDLEAIR